MDEKNQENTNLLTGNNKDYLQNNSVKAEVSKQGDYFHSNKYLLFE